MKAKGKHGLHPKVYIKQKQADSASGAQTPVEEQISFVLKMKPLDQKRYEDVSKILDRIYPKPTLENEALLSSFPPKCVYIPDNRTMLKIMRACIAVKAPT